MAYSKLKEGLKKASAKKKNYCKTCKKENCPCKKKGY